MQIGELAGSGHNTDVLVIDEHRVLRRYRDGSNQAGEAALLAYRNGREYPVPAVNPICSAPNRRRVP